MFEARGEPQRRAVSSDQGERAAHDAKERRCTQRDGQGHANRILEHSEHRPRDQQHRQRPPSRAQNPHRSAKANTGEKRDKQREIEVLHGTRGPLDLRGDEPRPATGGNFRHEGNNREARQVERQQENAEQQAPDDGHREVAPRQQRHPAHDALSKK